MAANLKEVRERIKSVISTQQITKAMKMVSAAKLRKAQQAIVEMRPYADRLNVMLGNILQHADGDVDSNFGKVRPIQHACVVVVTSSKGLCGAFNTNIIKAANARIQSNYADQLKANKLTILCIGKKGYDYFRKMYKGGIVNGEYADIFTHLNYESVSVITEMIMNNFADGTWDIIDVAYGRFKNAGSQFPEVEQFLPVHPAEKKSRNRADYIFEPDKQGLLDDLIPSILKTTFFKYLLDTHASEHGARMTAMDKASENAEELLKDLKISYNKARQEAITRELSEIVGGAAALENG